MKFKINREHFSTGLSQVLNIVGSKTTMPILGNVLIEAKDGNVSLTTTNLDLGIRCTIKADVSEAGALTLPVRKLSSIVKVLPSMEVSLEATPNFQAQIASGGSRYKIMGIEKEKFPPLKELDDQYSFTLEQAELVQMLRSVSYAQSSDENRYMLNGVYFSIVGKKLTLVATDGKRLALNEKTLDIKGDGEKSMILPAKTVAELERLSAKDSSIKVSFNERQASFEIVLNETETEKGLLGSIYLVSKVVEGQYPNYKQVIPGQMDHKVSIDRDLLQECITRAALVTSEKNNTVALKFSENLLEIKGQSSEYGESHETLAIQYNDKEVQAAFNPYFLLDPLKSLSKDEVIFEFKDELSPGIFKTEEGFLCVVMPLRLN